jgi:hypothetical protein
VTIGDTLSQTADAWTGLMATWTQTVQDLLESAVVDPLALIWPNAAMDQMFGWAERTFEINLDLLRDLTGVSVTAVPPDPPIAVAALPVAIDVLVTEVEAVEVEAVGSGKNATRPVAAAASSRTSKAELQKVLSDLGLPSTGTIKELRERLIDADRQTPG